MEKRICPECLHGTLPRRRFLATTASMAALPWIASARALEPMKPGDAENLVGEFYASLQDQQRKEICKPFQDALRSKIHANWHVTKPLIGSDFYTDGQRAIIDKIIRSLTTEDGFRLLQKQMDDDDGGQGAYSVGVFGEPQSGKYQWVLTGRHLTLRADGNSVPKTAFGGGLVYGHGEESSPQANVFYYQTKKANEVFKSLDADQVKSALLEKIPAETDLKIRGQAGPFQGLPVAQLKPDQKELFKSCLKTILGPYRAEDGDEAMKLVEEGGGLDSLRLAYYREGDLEKDNVWDNWRIEGPHCVVHFRGAPHVHAYIHIATPSSSA